MITIRKKTIYQFIYDQVYYSSYETRAKTFRSRIFSKIFDFLKRLYDPLIMKDIAGFPLAMRYSHELPFILKTFPKYSSNLARVVNCVKHKYEDLKFIDVGSNIGDTVALLRKESEFPILCIDGNSAYYELLQQNILSFREVYAVQTYLGETNESIPASSVDKGGTAYLKKSNSLKSTIHIRTLPEILKEYPFFSLAKMIKIDTDGYDGKILRGATKFLAAAKPVIFFEYDPFLLAQQNDDGISLFKILRKEGYVHGLLYDNFGEFMCSADLNNMILIQELHCYFSRHEGRRYLDICFFHSEDDDLFEQARMSELASYKK